MFDVGNATDGEFLHSAAEWAERIHQEVASLRSEKVTFRCLIGLSDELASAAPAARADLCATAPELCGDGRFDAEIAAIVDYRLSAAQLPVPDWVQERSRALSEEWVASPYADSTEVPPEFRRHGVLLAASELASI